MSRERASIFESDDIIDLSGFQPSHARQVAEKSEIEAVAERVGFVSREGGSPAQNVAQSPRVQRRRITGRNRQLNLKVTEAVLQRFYAIADGRNWVLGEAFEYAVDALARELEREKD